MSDSSEPGHLPGMIRNATCVRLVLADAERRPERTLEVSEIRWEDGVTNGQEALWLRVTDGSMVGIVCVTDPVRTPW